MKSFDGVFTALITPFKNGEVDLVSFKKLVEFQIQNGISKFVINGTTAESPALTWAEVESLFTAAKEVGGDKCTYVLGTGSNATAKTIETTGLAKKMGADGALVVCPYYNKPMPEGLAKHFLAVADSVELPIILYNVPGRTITEIPTDITLQLSKHPNIVAIKEATGDMSIGAQIVEGTSKDFVVTSGDDGSCFALALRGGEGVISVMSHILPKQTAEWMRRARNKDESVLSDFEKYEKLVNTLYIESNPIPVKKALQLMGVIESAELRLPMTEMSDDNTEKLKFAMQDMGLI